MNQTTTVRRSVLNTAARAGAGCTGIFSADEYEDVWRFFRTRPDLSPTPLRTLPTLALSLGVGEILLKDESERFGMDSFKIAGVSYAVDHLASRGRLAKDAVLACATEGNHGRAVARVARDYGLAAKVYVSSSTSPARVATLQREGADVMVIEGSYDDAVRSAARDAERHGWTIISDTSWPGYVEIPRLIMAGYTRLMDEAERQWGDRPPDALFVQAGVGGLTCAVISWLCHRYGSRRPLAVVCEPTGAACLLESAQAGRRIPLVGPFKTIMAGLRCGEVSSVAWPIIAEAADAFVAVDDHECVAAMRALAFPEGGEGVVRAGPSGACGLAALSAIMRDKSLSPIREAIGLGKESRVLVINTEGATDPEQYERLLGILL